MDLHIGTALRFGNASNPIDAESVKEIVEIVRRHDARDKIGQVLEDNSIDEARRAFKEAGFGLFVHFGLYSLLGGEYKGNETPFLAEWIRLTLDIPDDEYRSLAASFNPTAFDADRICELARSWGMKYICLTAKHHDGFALFDSSTDSFNSVAKSPSGRDFVREMAEACKMIALLRLLLASTRLGSSGDCAPTGKRRPHRCSSNTWKRNAFAIANF